MSVQAQRVVFLHPSDELYGADRMLIEMLDALPPEVEAEVWLPTDLTHPDNPLCEVLKQHGRSVRHLDLPIMRRAYKGPAGTLSLARSALRLVGPLRRRSPDIVYCTTSAAFLGAPAARLAGVHNVLGHVQEIWFGADRVLLTLPAACCGQLITISEATWRPLPKILRRRATIALNGTRDPGEPKPIDPKRQHLRFLAASRWAPAKGYETLLRAWSKAGIDAELVILGGPPPSGEQTDVVGLVAELGIEESVRVLGEVPDVGRYVDDADVMLAPSTRPEPFGLVAIEAFARGRPVIASASGGLLEIVRDDIDGWLFPPGDADALARILTRLNREDVIAAGNAARARFRANFELSQWRKTWRSALPDFCVSQAIDGGAAKL